MARMLNGNSYTIPRKERCYKERSMKTPTLSEIAEVLQNGMQPLFHRLKVDVTSCPCLTKEPYNLAGVGLCGNTAIIELGEKPTENVSDWKDRTCDIKSVLKTNCSDSFVIGSSYATKPHMPYYGHLIMNATYRAPESFTNASRIVFIETGNGQRRIETVTDPNQLTCTHNGCFFVSEGRPGNVVRVRAKGRKMINTDIITSMQTVLYESFGKDSTETVALGGVLRMRYGQVACNVMLDEYPDEKLQFVNFYFQQQYSKINLESDMIAVGVIFDDLPILISDEEHYGISIYNRSEFHCFSDHGTGGQFISDISPDTTEYEGYFNVVKKYIVLK
ncbi:PREDICTED: ester hydrolase C11orf54 homolog [Cyphomyrmex costatus]|uniref:ester hydrolase C11orf54 homolog n=1 Tax=Cyphomyrmex costatus TaxID=456900 RepID=UPI000852266C|nr:PREDICTED: ester hydrolase C11orf54 homolog [Cyphomyrmex costatus]